MAADAYDTLAGVYDWLVPDALLEPEGSAAAFAGILDALKPGARVLDCAAGTGELAVGLALRGLRVVASDASGAMVERTRRLARDRGVAIDARVCAWEELDHQGWAGFDAVLCVGNSLTHAAERAARRAALAAMASVLRPGGLVAVTSRNWELVRSEGSGLSVADRLVERAGLQGLVVHGWAIPDDPDEPHHLDVAVALLGDGADVTTHHERLRFWPFTHEQLDEDLRAAGLEPTARTYASDVEHYLVTARLRTVAGLNRG